MALATQRANLVSLSASEGMTPVPQRSLCCGSPKDALRIVAGGFDRHAHRPHSHGRIEDASLDQTTDGPMFAIARLLVACAIVGTVLGFGSDPTI
jgi:hypothetical protein